MAQASELNENATIGARSTSRQAHLDPMGQPGTVSIAGAYVYVETDDFSEGAPAEFILVLPGGVTLAEAIRVLVQGADDSGGHKGKRRDRPGTPD